MATYRCLASGNTVTFTLPHDIESMKGHSGYVMIDEPEQEETRPLPMMPPQQVKRPGRPPKQPKAT
jgi:hypothetical protein